MKITLDKQWCGHVKGATVSVSDKRALYLMLEGVAVPDKDLLAAHRAKVEAAEKAAEKAAKKAKKEKNEK